MTLKGKYILQNYKYYFCDVTVIFQVGFRKWGKREKQNFCYGLYFVLTSLNFRHCCPFLLLFKMVDLINEFSISQPVLHLWITRGIRIAHPFPSIHGMHCSSMTSNIAETLCYYSIQYSIVAQWAFLLPSVYWRKTGCCCFASQFWSCLLLTHKVI